MDWVPDPSGLMKVNSPVFHSFAQASEQGTRTPWSHGFHLFRPEYRTCSDLVYSFYLRNLV